MLPRLPPALPEVTARLFAVGLLATSRSDRALTASPCAVNGQEVACLSALSLCAAKVQVLTKTVSIQTSLLETDSPKISPMRVGRA